MRVAINEDKQMTQSIQNVVYMSSTMMQLRKVLEDDDSTLFERLCVQSQIFDQDENLMLLYVAAICMNNERAFD